MRTLHQALGDLDLGFLRLIRDRWGFDLALHDRVSGAQQLAGAMLAKPPAPDLLTAESRDLLEDLLRAGGKLPYAALARQYGGIRALGSGRRDREQPWLQPISPTEDLWYRGLIFRAFFDADTGPQEFAYVPEDLIPLLPKPAPERPMPLGRASDEPEEIELAQSLDDGVTLLAGLRKGLSTEAIQAFLHQPPALDLLLQLLTELELLTGPPYRPVAEALPEFLQDEPASRQALLSTWKGSPRWNDLAALKHLKPAGESWPNDPLTTRAQILSLLESVPGGTWWSLDDLVQDIRARHPDFQRPAGDFDSWIFQHAETNEAIHGMKSWNQVEAALLRYVICGPLHWLGAIDLGRTAGLAKPAAFRITPMLKGGGPPSIGREGKFRLNAAAQIRAPRNGNLQLRYQIARFADWEGIEPNAYHYALTPKALKAAQSQGLRAEQVLRILAEAADRHPPEHLVAAVHRWYERGTEIRLEGNTVLRVESEATIKELQSNPRTARFIREVIGPRAFTAGRGDLEALFQSAIRAAIWIDLGDE